MENVYAVQKNIDFWQCFYYNNSVFNQFRG